MYYHMTKHFTAIKSHDFKEFLMKEDSFKVYC